VPSVRVSLSYVDSGTRVTEARDVTTQTGEAYLTVSTDAAGRGDLRIEISGVTDLAIYQPADGQLTCPADQKDLSKCPYMRMTALPSRITVSLLPEGSLELAGHPQIEAFQRRQSLRINSLQKQNLQQQGEIKDLQAQADSLRQEVNVGLEEWAKANGLELADVQKKVQEWAQSTPFTIKPDQEDRAANPRALLKAAQCHHGYSSDF